MKADLIIININKLYNPTKTPPIKGSDMSVLEVVDQPFIAIKSGKILDYGTHDFEHLKDDDTTILNAQQKICLPGFIDSHTHLVHAGSREHEFEKLRQDVPYLDILKQGGGILGTVDKTRKASFDDLYHQAYQSLNRFLEYGVTTLEAKSGYGLSLEHEIKQLKVAHALNEHHPIDIISTYMGAHAIPNEFKNNKEAYIKQIKADLEMIKTENLAEFVDVFCETGVFSVSETKDILEHAKSLGFKIKVHADEIDPLGGTGLGVDLKATSVDHLMAIKDVDIEKLASSMTIGNILPGTSFYLNKNYANARKMIDHGCAISISSDYNPGSCPTENFQLIMQLAANHLKLKPEEIVNAVTLNAAYHLGIDQTKGSIQKGKNADLILLDIPNLSYMLYHFGINHISDVIVKGKHVIKSNTERKTI
ncbi:imidazolonepropionase [Tenericutes bacterium MZ-XQ]|nr:imidazolonepropionase [Tenericutes bacterium MZ-XQ]